MSHPVPADQIERIVGARRHPTEHLARAKSDEKWVYILHSAACLEEYGTDLTQCPFSSSLDDGIDPRVWVEDAAIAICMGPDGRLIPKDGAVQLDLLTDDERNDR